MTDVLDQLQQLRDTERRVAMATLVAARGGSPRPLGAKLFVGAGGRLVGSVSIGGCVDARVIEHGERILGVAGGRCERVTVTVDDQEALELGLNCGAEFDLFIESLSLADDDPTMQLLRSAASAAAGGHAAYVVTQMSPASTARRVVMSEGRAIASSSAHTIPVDAVAPELQDLEKSAMRATPSGDVFIDRLAPPDTLVIVGASDVAAALSRFGHQLGMRVVVIDGRERYATRERFSQADEVRVGMPSELVRPYLVAGASIVLVAHEYKYELPILRDALRSPARFVGMLAGRKRADGIRTLLREDGLSEEQLARLHAPIGLDIGGREPEEIALSIAAQLIAVREGKAIGRRS